MLTHERLLELLEYDPLTGIFRWRFTRVGCSMGLAGGFTSNNKYHNIRIGPKTYLTHRLAWFYVTGEWPNFVIDHINRDKFDNRIANLRQATWSENKQNVEMRRDNTSGFRGVLPHGNKWRADIALRGKKTYLGLFATPELASAAYTKKALEIHPFTDQATHKGTKPSADIKAKLLALRNREVV